MVLMDAPPSAAADNQLPLPFDVRSTAALTISVIIPVHKGGDKFRLCLQSLKAVSPPPLEIIVVADGDSDDSSRVADEFGAQVILLSEAGGPARARNAGARAAHSDVLVFFRRRRGDYSRHTWPDCGHIEQRAVCGRSIRLV
jgi:cellulose synthase/poly-beta-1,6-N-acetylglucosamine synthase-like glycosyltransferase